MVQCQIVSYHELLCDGVVVFDKRWMGLNKVKSTTSLIVNGLCACYFAFWGAGLTMDGEVHLPCSVNDLRLCVEGFTQPNVNYTS